MVDIKAEELGDFVTKRLAYEIYKHPDLVDVYNSINPNDEIRKLGYHLRGIRTAIGNTTKAIGKGTTPELEDKLKPLPRIGIQLKPESMISDLSRKQ